MSLVEKINEGIKDAMRSKDSVRLNTLRMLKSKILAVNARGDLPDTEISKLFKTYLGNLEEALEQSKIAQRPEAVTQLEREISIVKEFLPQGLSMEETRQIVLQAIEETGAKTKKELGFVMKKIMQINSSVDGKIAKELASPLLLD